MAEYGPETYGDRWAEIYDEWVVGVRPDEEATAEFLASLAGGGPALELAIGTGRVALPLAARGIEVHGIDASERMVAKLREKPGGSGIPVTMGDFADVAVAGTYPLIYVVFNTLFALLTQEDQVRCFQNVAGRLTEDGLFVIQAFVPDMTRFDRGQRVETIRAETDLLYIDGSTHDVVGQRVQVTQAFIRENGVRLYPVRLRYAYPPELDLMARLAGLQLRDRWSGWSGEPFTGTSQGHVSVYERARG